MVNAKSSAALHIAVWLDETSDEWVVSLDDGQCSNTLHIADDFDDAVRVALRLGRKRDLPVLATDGEGKRYHLDDEYTYAVIDRETGRVIALHFDTRDMDSPSLRDTMALVVESTESHVPHHQRDWVAVDGLVSIGDYVDMEDEDVEDEFEDEPEDDDEEVAMDCYYVTTHEYVGPPCSPAPRDTVRISTEPPRTNISHDVRTEGWLGTTNDWSANAHGAYDSPEAAEAYVREHWDVYEIPDWRDDDPDPDTVLVLGLGDHDPRDEWDRAMSTGSTAVPTRSPRCSAGGATRRWPRASETCDREETMSDLEKRAERIARRTTRV